jgi:hypothetical protein
VALGPKSLVVGCQFLVTQEAVREATGAILNNGEPSTGSDVGGAVHRITNHPGVPETG